MLSLALARPGAVALAPGALLRHVPHERGRRRHALRGRAARADFTLDEAALLAAIARHRPALTWIAYPNNPTGNLFPREAILRAVAASPGLVVVDEAYFPFSGRRHAAGRGRAAPQPACWCARSPSSASRACASGSRSAPARLDRRVREAAPAVQRERAHRPRPRSSCSRIATCSRRRRARIVAERARLEAALDAHAAACARFPSAANFVLARVPDAPRAFEGARGAVVYWFATCTARIRSSPTA